MQVLFIQIAILEAREDELKVVLFSCNLSLERLYHGNHEKKKVKRLLIRLYRTGYSSLA